MRPRYFVIQRILGVMVMGFSLTMLPPMLVSWGYADGEGLHFVHTLLVTLAVGLVLWAPVRRVRAELRVRDGFMVVALFWLILGALSSIPIHFSAHLGFTDAVFESFSGFTTTGATVIEGLDGLPPSILYYRQQLQWLGGMGIVMLAVAVLPMLGIGGMQLYRAETPGPMKDDKLTPRIRHTAQALWGIYLGLTAACALAYWLAGMDAFDALCHSFSTVSTGGFSTHDASIAHFHSPLIEWLAVLFMFLGGVNFSVHFLAVRRRGIGPYLQDLELRALLAVVSATTAVVAVTLWLSGVYGSPGELLTQAAFQVVSLITSTGFTSAPFADWPAALPALLIFITFIGGCSGSTAGGIKVVRVQLLYKQLLREMRRLMHPSAVVPLKLGGRILPERVVTAVWGFFAAYVLLFAALILAVMATGADQVTAFSTVATCLNNAGPALGAAAANFAPLNAPAKWILCLAMLLGRLEIFTLFVLVTPAYWRG